MTDSVYDTRDPAIQKMLFTGPAGGAPQLVQLQLAALKGSAPAADSDGAAAPDTGSFCAREAYSQVQCHSSVAQYCPFDTGVDARHRAQFGLTARFIGADSAHRSKLDSRATTSISPRTPVSLPTT